MAEAIGGRDRAVEVPEPEEETWESAMPVPGISVAMPYGRRA